MSSGVEVYRFIEVNRLVGLEVYRFTADGFKFTGLQVYGKLLDTGTQAYRLQV